jgi:hypothetical protein
MGAIAGKEGNVTFSSGYTTGVFSWSIDYNAEALEETDFADLGYRTYIPGLKGWSGSFECRLDNSSKIAHPGKPGASATFQATTGVTYYGNILVTGLALSTPVDGIAAVTVSFQGSGPLGITGVTTTTTSSSTSTSSSSSSSTSTSTSSSTTSTAP